MNFHPFDSAHNERERERERGVGNVRERKKNSTW
jgi:hypothetical protein